jgi:multidrug efflux system outer membrane protein
MRGPAFSVLAAAFLAGCVNLAPSYTRPEAPVPAAWKQGGGEGGAVSVVDLDWRNFMTDVRLRGVVDLALQNNRDLRVALLNIERARAQYRIERSELFPAIGVNAAAARQRSATGPGRPASISTQYSVELGFANYELDLFGRVKNLSESALETFFATEENQRSTRISLIAEVANTWLALAADSDRTRLAQQTLANQQSAYELVRRTHELGGTSGLTLAQAQTTVDAARVELARHASQAALNRNALELLAGTPLPDDLLPGGAIETASLLVDVPAGLPSQVLLRRPDVAASEHLLRAANADIGAARAAYFPRISLTAAAGVASASLSGLFGAGSGMWRFIPQLALPIFDAGGIRATVEATKVQRDIAIATYEKTLQVAFREVADALAQRATLGEQLAAQRSLAAAAARILELSNALFKNGANSYLQVLDAQRTLYAAEQALITLRVAEQTNRINLYKALGGG